MTFANFWKIQFTLKRPIVNIEYCLGSIQKTLKYIFISGIIIRTSDQFKEKILIYMYTYSLSIRLFCLSQ